MPGQWGMDAGAAFTYTMCVFSTLKTKTNCYLKDISRRSTKINLYCRLPPPALLKESSPCPPLSFPLSHGTKATRTLPRRGASIPGLTPTRSTCPLGSCAARSRSAHSETCHGQPVSAAHNWQAGRWFPQQQPSYTAAQGKAAPDPIPGTHGSPAETDKCERAAKPQQGNSLCLPSCLLQATPPLLPPSAIPSHPPQAGGSPATTGCKQAPQHSWSLCQQLS